jgi:proton-dependent oligopeptide transporter, POT family
MTAVAEATLALPRSDASFLGHPRGLATLFLTEMWERFSYYGMRALLILFMVATPVSGGLGFSIPKAAAVYGLYTASVYLAGLPGGWVADRILGLRRAVLVGGVLIACGHVSLILHSLGFFYAGLVLIVAGTGLLKANISAIVGELYAPGDTRRDGGFSLFYMGINLGGFLAPLACGYLGQRVGWHWGFALAALGMSLAVLQFSTGQHHLGQAGVRTIPSAVRRKALGQLAGGGLVSVLAIGGIAIALRQRRVEITAQSISTSLGFALAILSLGLFLWLFFAAGWSKGERRKLVVILVLFLASALFWSLFEQGGSTLNLFADRNTNCVVWRHSFPSSWFQALGSLFIILLAPLFAWFWVWLGPRDPSSPRKFSVGLAFAGLGFAVLLLPLATVTGRASPLWLVVTYLLLTFGELSLSPVGLSAMTKLAPARAAGLIMGAWFLSTSLGNYLGSRSAGLYERVPLLKLFLLVACAAFAGALLLALVAKRVERLAEELAPTSAEFSPC